MGTLFWVVVGVLAAIFVYHHYRNANQSGQQLEHQPLVPFGVPVEPWGPSVSAIEVVGEYYRSANIARLYPTMRPLQGGGADYNGTAILTDDGINPHSPLGDAVAVWIGGEHVGYLAAETATRYSPAIKQLAVEGKLLEVRGRLWARPRDDGEFFARATVWLPEPDAILQPEINIGDGAPILLPAGDKIKVSKTTDHMNVLKRYARGGAPVLMAASLHAIEEVRPRSVVETVEVRIGDERVGILTPTMTERLLPLVRYVEARGLTAVARAEVVGTKLDAKVHLFVVRSDEVSEAWLDALGSVESRSVEFADHFRPVPEPMWDDDLATVTPLVRAA